MSTEQAESKPAVAAHSQGETHTAPAVTANSQVDITQQATTTTTQRVKNPKRVAAGKMVAERTRLAREQQKKAAEAYFAENEAKAATEAPEPAPTNEEEGESPKRSGGEKNNGLSTTQWLAVGSIVVSLIGIYYKREELKAMAKPVFDKIKTPEPAPEPASVEPEPARATQRKGF